MKYSLTIDRLENEKAILKTEDGETIIWPKNKLPINSKEGSVLTFIISSDLEQKENKKELAKNILNELLDVEKD